MDTVPEQPIVAQLARLCDHLGIRRAHILASMPDDFHTFVCEQQDRVASLTLICPGRMSRDMFNEITCPLLVFTGEHDRVAPGLIEQLGGRPDTTLKILPDYTYQLWSDVIADHTQTIGEAVQNHLARIEGQAPVDAMAPGDQEGQVGDLFYRIRGAGPPLLLLPLVLAPSQWDPLIPQLSEQFCTITLGGRVLGITAVLERRAQATSYLDVVANLLARAQISAQTDVLEVGCGTGVLMRWLAKQPYAPQRITAVDINSYLLREARALARQEGLADCINFRDGDAAQLPFGDNQFDVTMSSTMLEEVDADHVIAEMVRVTKPGGRVAIVVRALDMHRFIHLPLPLALKIRLEGPGAWGAGVEAQGCADASLYARMEQAGLQEVKRLPQLAVYDNERALRDLERNIVPLLDPAEVDVWRRATTEMPAGGGFFYANPLHCAVGIKG